MTPLDLQQIAQSPHAALSLHALTAQYLIVRLAPRRLVHRSVSGQRHTWRTHNGIFAQIAPAPARPRHLKGLRTSVLVATCMRLRCQRLARLLGLVLLVGLSACGSPSPDAPVASDGLAAHEPARQAQTQTSPLGPTTQQASTPGPRITDASRATNPAPNAHVQTAASPTNTPQPDERADANQAQREARQLWFEEVRENPDVTVRLQALELWAEQPGDDIDPLAYALVDEDEEVRARAEELWEQQLTREEAETAP